MTAIPRCLAVPLMLLALVFALWADQAGLAPDFSLVAGDRSSISLAAYAGRIVVCFYEPKNGSWTFR
jgi:hypothetical protein